MTEIDESSKLTSLLHPNNDSWTYISNNKNEFELRKTRFRILLLSMGHW